MKPEDVAEFWDEVAKIGWSKKADIKAIEKKLLKSWAPEKAERMREVFDEMHGQLYEVLDQKVEGVGDDGFNDLLAHIVGMGKEEFERNLADPTLAQKRADADDYEESFAYVLPHEDTYECLKPATYVKQAKEIITELKKGLKDDRFVPVYPAIEALIDIFKPAAAGAPKNIMDCEKDALKLHKAIERRAEWLWRDVGVRDGSHFAYSAQISNFFHDVRNYLEP